MSLGVVTPCLNPSPDSRLGRTQARIAQGWANTGDTRRPSGTVVGIDGSKAEFDVAVRPAGEHGTSAHTEAGIAMFVTRLVARRPTLVV